MRSSRHPDYLFTSPTDSFGYGWPGQRSRPSERATPYAQSQRAYSARTHCGLVHPDDVAARRPDKYRDVSLPRWGTNEWPRHQCSYDHRGVSPLGTHPWDRRGSRGLSGLNPRSVGGRAETLGVGYGSGLRRHEAMLGGPGEGSRAQTYPGYEYGTVEARMGIVRHPPGAGSGRGGDPGMGMGPGYHGQ